METSRQACLQLEKKNKKVFTNVWVGSRKEINYLFMVYVTALPVEPG
jgi:hypothetical protein